MTTEASTFRWQDLGDIAAGRPNLGPVTSVAVYRLMQFTLLDVLRRRVGPDETDRILYEAGSLAGREFCLNLLDRLLPFDQFIAALQQQLKEHHMGILRVERVDTDQHRFQLAVAEDLECSGMPVTDETICTYDEGFLAGVFSAYTGQPYTAREMDCWGLGSRTCRFDLRPTG